MEAATDDRSLRPTDYLGLLLLCAALAAPALLDGRWLTTHEATHCLNVREMFESGNFLVPTYGGRPWLERPPVPHWFTGVFAELFADTSTTWAMRIGSAVAAAGAVLAMAWAVAGCFGRGYGLTSGAVLATFREFAAYAVGPEADIFVAVFVTLAGALFLRAEFTSRDRAQGTGDKQEDNNHPTIQPPNHPTTQPSHHSTLTTHHSPLTFFGPRPWPVLGVFVVLGLTNAMKGPLFGTAFLASAMGVYFIVGREWNGLGRYVWFWGWLAYVAVGGVLPLLTYLRHPEVADVWMNDYGKRLSEGYIGEPPWYYLFNVPWNLFPWTLPALVGLWYTAKSVFRDRDRPWQFLWAWALIPPVVFSVFQGKHHHYMLSCIAPWAPIAVAGAVAMRRTAFTWPAWLRSPVFGLLVLGVPGAIAALALAHKIPGPEWVAYTVAIGWPVVAAAGWYFAFHPNARTALVGFLGVILVVHVAAYLHRTAYLDSYAGDREFVAKVREIVPADEPIYVLNEPDPLNAAWLMYYLGPQTQLLHDMSFLISDRIAALEVYVIARGMVAQRDTKTELARYGAVTRVTESPRTRGELSPAYRYTLFRLRFFPNLKRYPEPPVNGMQATGRSSGPTLPEPTRNR